LRSELPSHVSVRPGTRSSNGDAGSSGYFREEREAEPLDIGALAEYLAQSGHILNRAAAPRQFAGGLGNWNYLVRVDERPYVLRRPPAGPRPAGANDMAREYRVLSRLPKQFPLAPEALLYCTDSDAIGAPFILIEYREGVIIRDTLPQSLAASVDAQRALASSVIAVLAQLHALKPDEIGLGDLGRPHGMVARQARNWTLRAQAAFGGQLPQGLDTISKWLERPPPPCQFAALLHNDFKLDNLILRPDTLAPVALIDWDMGTLGDPLLDVATLLSYWAEPGDHPAMLALRQMPTAAAGFPRRSEVLEMYARRTGLAVDGFKYYRVLALFKLCVVFQQIYQRQVRSGTRAPRASGYPELVSGLIDFTTHALAHERY
jgi:aminoglycoside phosphotransferase (APT) family kinase protein